MANTINTFIINNMTIMSMSMYYLDSNIVALLISAMIIFWQLCGLPCNSNIIRL